MHLFAASRYNNIMAPNSLKVLSKSPVPTEFGIFDMHVFRWDKPNINDNIDTGLALDHMAVTMGNILGKEDVLVRIHSECLTSESFGSLNCDCRKQLIAAQKAIAENGTGIILYLRQEGRGIGLANKIKAYRLQSEGGHDTVDANRLLGLPDDMRDYSAAAAMLKYLGPMSINLLTNNPLKLNAMKEHNIITKRKSLICTMNSHHASSYLASKRDRMGHML